ncbi:hypothetical protein DERP_013653 [Dermatophagoides pteronyssinus]|uniref:Uncharacterized protein n=1 Tax=Dermatophagoides pteronyssinus TaxID=6956 RepID=A0ABQ8IQN2_DERPT|nr:hypothetical protein DERP_013653 [Dermatophagoides pteronyssinus]
MSFVRDALIICRHSEPTLCTFCTIFSHNFIRESSYNDRCCCMVSSLKFNTITTTMKHHVLSSNISLTCSCSQ